MKKSYTLQLSAALLAVLFLVLSASTLKAQDYEKARTKTAVANLINGINSDNSGLKRSAIYFAGKYQVKETLPALFAQLKMEENESTRILIGLTIYTIGDQSGMDRLRQAAEKENNVRVKRMFSEICEQYSVKTASLTSSK